MRIWTGSTSYFYPELEKLCTYLRGILKIAVILTLLLSLDHILRAQDTNFVKKYEFSVSSDSLNKDSLPRGNILYTRPPSQSRPDSLSLLHDPRKAALFSAVLPGLGQAYNHKYWKIPIAYAGLATATGFFVFNYKDFLIYRDAYRLVSSNQKSTDPQINTAINLYSPSDLQIIRDSYRQYVDYSVLGFAAVYFLDILDAVVDAHLYYFNVNNDISLKLEPCAGPGYAGLALVFRFVAGSRSLHPFAPAP
jgi:hypothetical protein